MAEATHTHNGRRRPGGWFRMALPAIVATLLATSCRTVAPPVETPIAVPEAFSRSGEAAPAEEWWREFGDERLNELVTQALAGNFGLRTARDRLAQARAVARRAGADRRPAVNGTAGVERTVTKTAGMERQYATDISLGLSASYEVDLWGRVEAAEDAALLDALASAEDLRAAAVSLSAQVATLSARPVNSGTARRSMSKPVPQIT